MDEDWEDWLLEHFKSYEECYGPDMDKKKKYIGEALANFLSGNDNAFSNMRRIVELAEAFGELHHKDDFAGNNIDDNTIVNIPLTRKDIDEIHRALWHLVEEEINEEVETVERKEEIRKREEAETRAKKVK
jgi:hypothetical protein